MEVKARIRGACAERGEKSEGKVKGMGLQMKEKLHGVLEEQMNKQYAGRLAGAKRRISYEEWLRLVRETADGRAYPYEPGIQGEEGDGALPPLGVRCAAAAEQGLALLREQGIWLLLRKGGYVDPEAYALIGNYFREHPQARMLYGDEDALDVTGKHRCNPCFRPVWSPDTWLSGWDLGSVVALRGELAAGVAPDIWPEEKEGVILWEDSAQARRLVYELLKLAGGFQRGCDAIAHLPGMLFHAEYDAARTDAQREYRGGEEWKEPEAQWQQDKRALSISVVIPTRDHPEELRQCLDSLQKCWQETQKAEAAADCAGESGQPRLEILVVDNGSSPENRAEIGKITRGMKYIYEPMPFNFSKMCNLGAREAAGDLLLFLNDDITVPADGWLEAMALRAMRPYVGAVGLKLYYPDSTKIQHAGIANLPGGPVHKLQFTRDGQEEDYGYGSLDRNVAAVTGACLMVQRERFWQVGGFPEDLQVAYNDVELCFLLREEGWHNVVLNRFHAWHHESLSRGSDLTGEKMERLRQEKQTLYRRHPEYLDYDPYYPEPLCMELGDTRIYENYLDTRSEAQIASRCQQLAECPEQEPENLKCVVEFSQNAEHKALCAQGYVVVKGDNNACYDRYLLLRRQGEESAHVIPLEDKYSQEAEYGMQEQPNVALCGFQVVLRRGLLPEGSYKIGFQARSRIGRRRLTMWTEAELLTGGNAAHDGVGL